MCSCRTALGIGVLAVAIASPLSAQAQNAYHARSPGTALADRRWTVLGPDFDPIERVVIPPCFRLADARNDQVLLIETDSVDRQRVVPYRLEPRTPDACGGANVDHPWSPRPWTRSSEDPG